MLFSVASNLYISRIFGSKTCMDFFGRATGHSKTVIAPSKFTARRHITPESHSLWSDFNHMQIPLGGAFL